MTRAGLLIALATLPPACGTYVTPAAIEASAADPAKRHKALELWTDAVGLTNAFLASSWCHSLPRGRFELDPDDGMTYHVNDERWTGKRVWPVRVKNSWWGHVVLWSGARAQEFTDGFTVGARGPEDVPAIDHSMFRYPDGEWHDRESVARLILHETAHSVHGEGTIGFGGTILNYLEVIFLWRTMYHSAERRPRAVTEEFTYYSMWRLAVEGGNQREARIVKGLYEEHMGDVDRDPAVCIHGLGEEGPGGGRDAGIVQASSDEELNGGRRKTTQDSAGR